MNREKSLNYGTLVSMMLADPRLAQASKMKPFPAPERKPRVKRVTFGRRTEEDDAALDAAAKRRAAKAARLAKMHFEPIVTRDIDHGRGN